MRIPEKPLTSNPESSGGIEERTVKVGLALGGGVVRGVAHLGVLSVFEKEGIPIDYVSGSSVGALIGAIYCSGLTTEEALEVTSHTTWFHLANLTWPKRGLFSFDKMEYWLTLLLGDLLIEAMPRRFAAVTTDLDTGEKVVLERGRLAPAVRASCSIPGIVAPRLIDGRLLGDGTLVDSVPVSVAREMGADYVIGVDILQPTVREGWGAVGFGLDALEILVRQAGNGFQTADTIITPDLAGMTYIRFSKVKELFARGAQAAERSLERIQADLVRLGGLAASDLETEAVL